MRELQLCLFLKPTYSCSARERESWGASERPDAVTARLPVVGGEEEDRKQSATSSYPMARPMRQQWVVVGVVRHVLHVPVYW